MLVRPPLTGNRKIDLRLDHSILADVVVSITYLNAPRDLCVAHLGKQQYWHNIMIECCVPSKETILDIVPM